MVDLSRLDSNIDELKERASDLEMEMESVFTRLTALEAARAATPPGSDDEIVEALAQTLYCAIAKRPLGAWDEANALFHTEYRIFVARQLPLLRELGFDVVKRS